MDLEQIVQQILLVRHDLSREEVLKKIVEKKLSAQDYYLDEVAARLVASELGVEIPTSEEAFQPQIAVKDLVSGLNDVTVIARVIIVYPIQTFTRPDLTEGKVARLLLSDKTGSLRLVLWNDKISMAESGKVRQGQIIRVLHGYAREGIDGKLELHLGDKGDLEPTPTGVVEADFPQVADFIDKIGKLTPQKKRVNIVGLVHEVFPVSEFKRQNGTAGKVRRLRLRDDTGEAAVVVWNERVDQLGDVKKGDCLRIMNSRVKETPDGRLELHVENATQIEKLNEQEIALSVAPPRLTKINELAPNTSDASVLARVLKVEDVREFKRANGETGQVATLYLGDGTGAVQLNLWDEKAQTAQQTHVGDTVLLEHAYTRQRFNKTELNLGAKGSLTINPALPEAENLPTVQEEQQTAEVEKTKIASIQNEGGPYTVEATVASQPDSREVNTYQNERVQVTSFDIADETGKIRVSLWREQSELAKTLALGTKIRLINIYAKHGFSNLTELVSRRTTRVEIVSSAETAA